MHCSWGNYPDWKFRSWKMLSCERRIRRGVSSWNWKLLTRDLSTSAYYFLKINVNTISKQDLKIISVFDGRQKWTFLRRVHLFVFIYLSDLEIQWSEHSIFSRIGMMWCGLFAIAAQLRIWKETQNSMKCKRKQQKTQMECDASSSFRFHTYNQQNFWMKGRTSVIITFFISSPYGIQSKVRYV